MEAFQFSPDGAWILENTCKITGTTFFYCFASVWENWREGGDLHKKSFGKTLSHVCLILRLLLLSF